MRKDRKFLRLASKLWPIRHRHFEDMCALAVTGQLGGPQMCELDEHIVACDSCRKYLESVAQATLQVMPILAAKHAPASTVDPPEGMRDRFLSRLAAESVDVVGRAKPRSAPILMRQSISLPLDEPGGGDTRRKKASEALSGSWSLAWRSAVALAACAVIGIAGYYIGQRKDTQMPGQATQLVRPSLPAVGGSVPTGAADVVGQLQRRKSQLEGELAQVRAKLAKATAEDEALHEDLSSAKAKLAALTTQAESAAARPAGRQEASDQVSALQAQVGTVSQRLAESEFKFDIERQASQELARKLDETTTDLQRERDLKAAKSEMGDLVAARNLHIVDVYDADPNGKRQRAFGRVFYIEGKSLVFYAYDLDDPRQHKANVVFHVWGGKAGVKEVTHSLGILTKDADGEGRWAMTFDDSRVLAQINSVFVTAESASKQYEEPHGKKILYAYFGSAPNHP